MYIRNINKIKTNNNMNTDIIVKYTFGTLSIICLSGITYAVGVVIINLI